MNDLPITIIYPDAFARSPPAQFDGVYHWEFWQSAINRRNIRPADIDAAVEIKSFFLMAETKDAGISLVEDDGQGRTRRALINTGLVTFIYQWGKKDPVQWQWETWREKSPIYTEVRNGPTMKHDIGDFIRRWADHHDLLDPNLVWRRRAIEAALHNAPPIIEIELHEQLRRRARAALGSYVETPLGQTVVE
jgi:hypothetical protein